jgi:dimethylamine/trimethylamine dehydrogenase
VTRDPKYDVLFEPVRIGPKTMRNRFYQAPHCSGFGSEYPYTQAEFRGMKAEGGWALVNTEYCSIHPECDDRPYIQARLWDDNDVRNLSLMCDRVHEHDSLAGVELNFSGPHHTGFESRQPARGVSQLPSPRWGWRATSCYEMDKREIRELQRFYIDAAKRARAAGFDLILIYGAETIGIPQQFLMRYFNQRTDEYGGSFENRARFFREVLELVREAVGDDCAVGARFSIDTLSDDDLGIKVQEDGIGFIQHVDHLVDLWDVQVGPPSMIDSTEDVPASRARPENYHRHWVEQIRPFTAKPIAGVGRFTNPDTMVAVIRSGQLDIIGAARPSIADPFLPRKIEEGQLGEIRECIGCNICLSRFRQGGGRLVCTQNPTSGEEYRRGWHPERFSRAANAERDVLVIGAGPAGMECAIVLGKRGMSRVHLVDAAPELGGAMRWIPKLPGLGEWGRVIDWRRIQIDKLKNVQFIPKTRLDVEGVIDYGADLVVVATGSRWAADGANAWTRGPVPGANAALAHCLTPEQIMLEGKQPPPGPVLVYDTDGYYMGASLAEKLAAEGRSVTLVTSLSSVGPFLAFTSEDTYVHETLRRLDVKVVADHVLTGIAPGRVEGSAVSGGDSKVWDAESVVLVTHRVSDGLYRELSAAEDELKREGIVGVYRAGDCVEPRLIADAVFDGHRLAREIDTEDPSKFLPLVRENLTAPAKATVFENTEHRPDYLTA